MRRAGSCSPGNEEDYRAVLTERYAKAARAYDGTRLAAQRSAAYTRILDRLPLGTGVRVMDVCSGTGTLALACAARGAQVAAIDISEAMLQVADEKDRDHRVQFALGRAEGLPFPRRTFDLALLGMGLYQMPADNRVQVVRELLRVSRGLVVLVEPLESQARLLQWARALGWCTAAEVPAPDWPRVPLDRIVAMAGAQVREERREGWMRVVVLSAAGS